MYSSPRHEMEVRNKFPALRGLPPVATKYGAGWAPESVWKFCSKTEMPCHYQETNPGRPVRSPVTVPTNLSERPMSLKPNTRFCVHIDQHAKYLTERKMFRAGLAEENETHFSNTLRCFFFFHLPFSR